MQPNQPNFDPNQPPQPQPQPMPYDNPVPAPQPYSAPAAPSPAPSPADPNPQPVNPFGPPIEPVASPNPFGNVEAPATPAISPFSPAPEAPIDQTSQFPPAGVAPTPAPKKSKKLLFIIIGIIIALILAAGAVFAATTLSGNKKDNTVTAGGVTSDADSADTTDSASKESVTAAKVGEYLDVCNGKKVANAAAAAKPYKGAGFVNAGGDWALFGLFGYGENAADADYEPGASNLAICLSPDVATATAPLTCENIKDPVANKSFTAQVKGVTYNVAYYAAQTGEKLGDDKITVAATCPPFGVEETFAEYVAPLEAQYKPVIDAFLAS